MKSRKQISNRGDILLLSLFLVALTGMIVVPLLGMMASDMRAANTQADSVQALQIAEAGINYYQWHLAHFPSDFQDGTGGAGPYVHSYYDADTQQLLGQYSLNITPPSVGSTIVTIQSTGSSAAHPGVTRTITAKYGIPSLAVYSLLTNDVIWIGSGETVSGQMQSNNGIRFDGSANAPIMSAKSTYTCTSGQGSPCPTTKNGIWGSASAAVQSLWNFPVPVVDFSTLTSDLASLKASAQASGIYLSPSNAQGYSLVFNSNGTVSIYKVTSLRANPTGWDVAGNAHNEYTDYNARTLQSTPAIPANGIIYIEDKIWVEGTVNGRVMVAAAQLPYVPSTAPTIYVPNNIVYAAKDGSSVLGLLAQKDFVVTNHAPNNLEIDAAIIAQNGSAQFFYYPGNIKTSILVYGALMTYGQWTWTWVNGSNNVVSGYSSTNSTYDANLMYSPPPSFPLSSVGYQQLTWTSN